MSHSADFFRDEVRNGFYISTVIKQAWAQTLDVLGEIDRICNKYDIRYFADWGTYLGAVRHGGFVPWDDDLDICMLRDDYIRFRQVADKELPGNYVIHDYARQKDHWLFLARVVNNDKMCFDENYLREHDNFPWLAGVDIFIKDYLYKDEEAEKARDDEVMNLIALAEGIVGGEITGDKAATLLRGVSSKYSITFPNINDKREIGIMLYREAERKMSEVNPEDADKVGQIFPWVLKMGMKASDDKAFYEKIIRLPFEDVTIPVPAAYNTVLTRRYGNYNVIRKVWTGHDYPFFEGQKREMEEISGTEFPHFTFDKSMLARQKSDKSGSLENVAAGYLDEIFALVNTGAGDAGSILGAAAKAQELAASLGTFIEETLGEDDRRCVSVTESLQEFCDALYEEYLEIEAGRASLLVRSREVLKKVCDCVRKEFANRREILFLTTGVRDFGVFKQFIMECNDETDICIIPLPVMKKDFYGKILMSEEEIASLVKAEDYAALNPDFAVLFKTGRQGNIRFCDYNNYDIRIHCPDTVYIQDPYDNVNPCLSVPAGFYTSRLRKYSERIVYVPRLKTVDFTAEDIIDQYNLRQCANTPGVICSDEVILWSENIKEQYVNALSAFAGEDTRDIWQNKITVAKYENKMQRAKRILWCIGLNELSENADCLEDAIHNRFGIIEEAKGPDVSVCLYPLNEDMWRDVNADLYDRICASVKDAGYAINDAVSGGAAGDDLSPDAAAEEFDAYYGSPSPFVPAFLVRKKPVMLANYKI